VVVLEAVLALVGLAALVGVSVRWHLAHSVEPPLEEDLARPYRDGLNAAIRMQVVAQDLERELYVEAARHAEADAGGEE
jgi:hypothetical protein